METPVTGQAFIRAEENRPLRMHEETPPGSEQQQQQQNPTSVIERGKLEVLLLP